MNRLLLVVLALLLAALGWQTWRLADASQTISTQADELRSKSQALVKSNSQLISLSILTETNNREQARLYAEAEQTSVLLRQRQHRIEELKRENEDLRRWADTPLPADIMPRRIEFTLSLKRVDESLSDMFGDLSAQLNNLQDTATSALSDISKTVGGLLS
ncbi:Rz-like lysis system protein LysB [Escherichia coli]|uniref:Rz-like lysis system protein LysB n=1 Tax=Escherichia coli TaxID=562 RepID=UPI000BE85CD6|nr:Rz-like lysis system protein LysB [Escherichia coli]